MSEPQRHRAGFLTYPGDCTHITGEVMYSPVHGIYLMAVSAVYALGLDKTHVAFAYCHPDDVKIREADGTMRLQTVSA